MSGPATTWEYAAKPALTAAELNELGRDGWELAGIDAGTFYLKRPAPSFKELITLEQREHYFTARPERDSR